MTTTTSNDLTAENAVNFSTTTTHQRPPANEAEPIAIGYVRVSTEMQAADGISIDAQKESIADYCRSQHLTLTKIYEDDHTGKTLVRPGFQAALKTMRETGAIFVAVKLDRVTRNVGDLDYLLRTYFGDGKAYALRLVQFPVDTSSSIGRLLLNIICSVAQWEREEICARTQAGMDFLRRQGVYLGSAYFGKRYSDEPDASGRRVLVDVPEEQAIIRQICALHDEGLTVAQMREWLTEHDVPANSRTNAWRYDRIYGILAREGRIAPKAWDRSGFERDKKIVMKRILELRADGLSLAQIGRTLTSERMMPTHGSKWYPATVNAYLREHTTHDQDEILRIVIGLRDKKFTLRAIAEELTKRGYTPKRGGIWHVAQVKAVLQMGELSRRGK